MGFLKLNYSSHPPITSCTPGKTSPESSEGTRPPTTSPNSLLPLWPPLPRPPPQPRQPAICLLSPQTRAHAPEFYTRGTAQSVLCLSGFYFQPSTLRCYPSFTSSHCPVPLMRWRSYNLLTRLSDDSYLGCFQLGAITNKVALNIHLSRMSPFVLGNAWESHG